MAFPLPTKTDSPSEGSGRPWDLIFWASLGALVLARLAFIAAVPLDLAPDEAYYWDWSRMVDWGYYSKPPMIAWINALSTGLLGSTPFSVRLPAVLLSAVSLAFIFLLTRRLFSSRTAFWGAFATAASPGSCALGFIMTIDAPLFCLWSAALYTFWRAVEGRDNSAGWWILLGIILGLGALSKQMMLVFPCLILIFLFFETGDRKRLKGPWPYISIVIGLLSLLPMVYWNMENHWITLQHTTHHFGGHHRSGLYFLKTFSDFLGSQAALITPLTWLLFILLSAGSLFRIFRLSRQARFLFLFGGFVLVFFFLLSFRQYINANWPGVFYISGLIALSGWYTGFLSVGKWVDKLRGVFVPGVLLGALLALSVYALPFVLPHTDLSGGKLDPSGRLRGWKHFAHEIDAVRHTLPRPEKTFILTSRRQYTSELAFYIPGHPRVYLWNRSPDIIRSQYDLWTGPEERLGRDCLLVLDGGEKPGKVLEASFSTLDHLGTRSFPKGKGGGRTVELYFGENLLRWPFQRKAVSPPPARVANEAKIH